MRKVFLVVGVVLALAGCGGSAKQTYPGEAVQNYMNACATLPGGTHQVCRCTLNQLEKQLSLDEFKSIARAMSLHTLDARQNKVMLDATVACAREATG
jgi:uncharacterized protein YceK